MWYEDMKADTAAAIEELGEFLQHQISSEQKRLLCEYVMFDNMKKNEKKNSDKDSTFMNDYDFFRGLL